MDSPERPESPASSALAALLLFGSFAGWVAVPVALVWAGVR